MAKKIITSALVIIVIIVSVMVLMIINTPKYGIIYYDLGDTPIADSQGNIQNQSNPLTGVIGVPKNTRNAPLVFIFHSDAKASDVKDDRYFSGFEYLVKSFADNGIVAVSINLNAQYYNNNAEIKNYDQLKDIFSKHLEQISKAAEGKTTKLGVDLNGKIDLTNINLIGHGASGQAVYIMANDFADKNIIKSIVMVDPKNIVSDKRKLPDIPSAILVSEHNGNLSTLDGYLYFDKLNAYDDRENIASITMLKGANDNFYNSYTKTDDVNSITQNRLSEDDQRYFLSNFCVEFVKSLSKKSRLGVFNTSVKSDERIFGFDVISTTLVPNRKYILNAPEDKKNKNSLGDYIYTNLLTFKKVSENTSSLKDTNGPFMHPVEKNGSFYMYELSFTQPKASMDIMIPKKDCDFSEYDGINLYLAPNPYSELTTENVKIDVVLTDTLDNKSIVSIDNMSALNYYTVADKENIYTPLSGARVPFTQFKGIDLESIKKVSIIFKNSSADIMLNSIYLFNSEND